MIARPGHYWVGNHLFYDCDNCQERVQGSKGYYVYLPLIGPAPAFQILGAKSLKLCYGCHEKHKAGQLATQTSLGDWNR